MRSCCASGATTKICGVTNPAASLPATSTRTSAPTEDHLSNVWRRPGSSPFAELLRSALDVRQVERRSQALCELLGVVVRPKVHEVEVGRVVDHVAVQRGHFDAVVAQRLD